MIEDVLRLFKPLGVIWGYGFTEGSAKGPKIWSRLNKEEANQEFEETRPGPAYTHINDLGKGAG